MLWRMFKSLTGAESQLDFADTAIFSSAVLTRILNEERDKPLSSIQGGIAITTLSELSWTGDGNQQSAILT